MKGRKKKSRVTVLVLVFAFLIGLVSLVMLFSIPVPVYAGAEDSGWITDRPVVWSEPDEFSPSMAADSKGNLYIVKEMYHPDDYFNYLRVYN